MQTAYQKKFFGHSWDRSAVGPVNAWSDQLKTTSEFMLATHKPMFVFWGEKERTLLFNEAFAFFLGERPFEALGRPASKVWADVWEDIGSFVGDVFRGQSILRQDVPFETWASDFTETRFYTLSYMPIWEPGGSVIGMVCLCLDTTQQVRANANAIIERDGLYRLFQEVPGFIAIAKGPDHRIAFANAAYVRLVGREVVGSTVAEIMPELIDQGFIELLDSVYATGERYVAHRMPIRFEITSGRGPEERFINFVYEAMRNEQQEIEGIFVEGFDVTDEVLAEEKIRSLQSELIYMSRLSAMGTMASTLAHELNQPLTAIMNYAGTVGRALDDAHLDDQTIRVGFQGIEQSARRAGEVIHSLREMTRRGQVNRSTLDFKQLCKEAVAIVRAGGSGEAEITCQITAEAEALGDSVQIQQVLINLIKNACEATEGQSEPKVTISSSLSEDGVRVCVADNGPGVAKGILKTDFGAFVSTKPDGMGIGLSICRTIIEAHCGSLTVRDNPGGGAIFSFVLPAREVPISSSG